MKKFFLAAAIAFVSAASFAQENNATNKKVGFSLGVELASPVGNLKNRNNFGIGGTAQVEYMASDMVGITLNAGFINYSGKTVNGIKTQSINQIPVLLGARYYFIKDIYLSGQLGFSSFNRNIGSAFTYAPGIGIKVSLIDLTLKYMGASKNGSSLSNVGLRVAVNF